MQPRSWPLHIARRRVLITTTVIILALAVGAIALYVRGQQLTVDGSVAVDGEDRNWMRNADGSCTTVGPYQVLKPGAELSVRNTSGDIRGRFTVDDLAVSRGADGVTCRAFFSGVEISGNDGSVQFQLAGAQPVQISHQELKQSTDSEAGGLGLSVVGCETACRLTVS